MFQHAYDRSGRYIGVRDMRSGRFVPDAILPLQVLSGKEIRKMRDARRRSIARAAQVLANATPDVRDVLPDDHARNRSYGPHMVGPDGEKVTRNTRLEDRYPAVPGHINAVKSSAPSLYHTARTVRRHTVPTGTVQDSRSARGIGALTAVRGGFNRK